jgi:hypothetical protein
MNFFFVQATHEQSRDYVCTICGKGLVNSARLVTKSFNYKKLLKKFNRLMLQKTVLLINLAILVGVKLFL